MTRSAKITIGVVVVILVVLWGITATQNRQTSQETVKIGVILPLTGNQAVYGQGNKEGLDVALNEINQTAERKIELIYEDNAGEVKNSVSAAQKLIEVDGVAALITVVSQHSLAVAPIAEGKQVVLYTMASQASQLKTAGDYVFKNDEDLGVLGAEMARFIFQAGHRSAGVIFAKYNDATVDAAQGFQETFEELGGTVVANESFSKDENDFRSYLAKIDSKQPETIFINGLTKDDAIIVKQIREMNMQQKLFASGAIEDPQVTNLGKDIVDGIVFASFQGLPSEQFVTNIRSSFNHDPLRWSMEAYDGLHIIAKAIARISVGEKVTPDLLKENLNQIRDYQGESGKIAFDEQGNARRPIFIKVIRDGGFELYQR